MLHREKPHRFYLRAWGQEQAFACYNSRRSTVSPRPKPHPAVTQLLLECQKPPRS